ncbi:ABC transporter permease [Rubinisphaera italica]|uniref:Macrolide export ATP-binding/permease protein MacB n=1 Tax=Rubinisphaera italica TaxID=2527969 RepID=A0A5C5XIE0_9PLAN|nr:ABC transporter permease [Rubinisphaera italica]TWT61582.1 Macrolide export ATP-binding/permease protein MacB [Rubinisphaera italica]
MITLRIAIRALMKNKMRAALTVLGVVIGIAAVTTMVSVGESAGQLIQSQFQALGTNVIVVLPGTGKRGGVRQGSLPSLTAEDAIAISDECPSVLASSSLVGAGGQVIYGNVNWSPKEMFGVGPDYLLVRNWDLRLGGFFAEQDVNAASKVCVIGQTVAVKLFQTMNPIGETIRIRNIPFRVIGVLAEKGANIVGDDQDNVLLMPYTTVRKRLYGSSFNEVNAVMVSARSVDLMSAAENEIKNLLANRHRIAPGQANDFQVQNTTEIANIFGVVTGTITAMLAAIAGISLLVGGVGIMNIMLVSVTERTREIGIRMAVGATGRDILMQFLVESVLLSSLGGVIGFLLGIAGSTGITMLINSFSPSVEWPIVVSLPAAVTAILFAAAVGIFFGFYPARRASQLDPIDALRYE